LTFIPESHTKSHDQRNRFAPPITKQASCSEKPAPASTPILPRISAQLSTPVKRHELKAIAAHHETAGSDRFRTGNSGTNATSAPMFTTAKESECFIHSGSYRNIYLLQVPTESNKTDDAIGIHPKHAAQLICANAINKERHYSK
jgi:hypothetical protein